MRHPLGHRLAGLAIGAIQLLEIVLHVRLEMCDPCLDLVLSEIAVTVVDRFEFAAVDRDYRLRE
jgi:hypothetical protein